MSVSMYDTITVDTVPANPDAVAGYVGGHWPTFQPLVARFPRARHLSIAVNAGEDAECLDVEPGDATPDQAPAWVARQRGRGVPRPVLYASVSEMPAVLAALAGAGIARAQVRLWTAHYTFSPHLCSPACGFGFTETADATQWTDRALGRNLDESLCADSFFAAPAPPPDPHHYERFPTGPFAWKGALLKERDTVLRYDGARQHPLRYWKLLGGIRGELHQLADRVYFEAHQDTPVSWGSYWRGWRYQQLIHRAQGERLA